LANNPRQKIKPSPHKKPLAVKAIESAKIPRSIFGPDPMRQNPAWRVSLMGMVSPFGWHEIQPEKLREVREKLRDFESMTWNEILVAQQHRNHEVTVDRLCKEARDRLEEIGQADIEQLVSLRLSGPERVWGIRSGNILNVLWWDPEHSVCPSPKKHT
jgi:hypothetical protein